MRAAENAIRAFEVVMKAPVLIAFPQTVRAAFFRIDECNLLVGAICSGNLPREPMIFIRAFGDEDAWIAGLRARLHDPLRVAPAMTGEIRLNDQDKVRFDHVGRHRRESTCMGWGIASVQAAWTKRRAPRALRCNQMNNVSTASNRKTA